MHELALSQNMVEIIEREARLQTFGRVETVRLEIGLLSCVEPEALRFCFDTVTRGTVADGALLEILTVPADACCRDCSAEFKISRRASPCPQCAGYRLDVQGGDQMRIKDLEIH